MILRAQLVTQSLIGMRWLCLWLVAWTENYLKWWLNVDDSSVSLPFCPLKGHFGIKDIWPVPSVRRSLFVAPSPQT